MIDRSAREVVRQTSTSSCYILISSFDSLVSLDGECVFLPLILRRVYWDMIPSFNDFGTEWKHPSNLTPEVLSLHCQYEAVEQSSSSPMVSRLVAQKCTL